MIAMACGTILSRPKGIFAHWGITTERGTVFHNTPEKGEHEATFEQFAAGQAVRWHQRIDDVGSFLGRLRLRRIQNKSYCALTNNCEHTVTALTENHPRSPQLITILAVIGGACIALIFLRKSS